MEKILKNPIIEEQQNKEDNDKIYRKESNTQTNKHIKCNVMKYQKCHPKKNSLLKYK